MRGLKRLLYSYLHLSVLVASFTDAWIETYENTVLGDVTKVASFTDAWIETSSFFLFILFFLVASFTDAWIETRI